MATKDITQEQADFLRQNGFSLDGFNVRGVDATTGLFSPKGGGALTPQQIIAAVRSGELAEGPALQALTQLFGGNANSARAYFNAASKGQSVSISQQNGVWSLQTDRPPPLDTNKRSFDQDLDRQIFGDDSTLKDDPFSFDEAFGNQGRRAQVTAFLGEQFPGIGGTFRNVIEGFRNPIANAFTVSKAFGGGDVLEDFLGTLGGANPRISDPQFGRLSDLIAAGPGAIGAGPEFDIQRSTLEGLTSPSGQRRQFELATNQRQRDLAFDLRGSFGRLADRRFDEILAEQGKDPAFQFLPFVQQRGLFGG